MLLHPPQPIHVLICLFSLSASILPCHLLHTLWLTEGWKMNSVIGKQRWFGFGDSDTGYGWMCCFSCRTAAAEEHLLLQPLEKLCLQSSSQFRAQKPVLRRWGQQMHHLRSFDSRASKRASVVKMSTGVQYCSNFPLQTSSGTLRPASPDKLTNGTFAVILRWGWNPKPFGQNFPPFWFNGWKHALKG